MNIPLQAAYAKLPVLGAIVLGSLLALPAAAQSVGGEWIDHCQIDSMEDASRFGFAVANAGDTNGDGYNDFVVGAPQASPNGLTTAGSVFLYSGLDGGLLVRLDGVAAKNQTGYSVNGAGDVDNDGYDDIIIGVPYADPNGKMNAGAIWIISGLTHALIYKIQGNSPEAQLGFSVDGIEDVNNDGHADFIAGAPLNKVGPLEAAGTVLAFSGIDGSEMFRIDSPYKKWWFGSAVSDAGDVNGDGTPDFAVGATFADVITRNDNAGAAFVFSGLDASLLCQVLGANPTDMLGNAIDRVGDVTGDGFDEIVVGLYLAEPNGRTGAGGAYVIDAFNGTLVHRVIGDAKWDKLGWSACGVGDVDGDMIPDFACGGPTGDGNGLTDSGKVCIYSGATGKKIHMFEGDIADGRLGFAVGSIGDIDGDGRNEVLMSAHRANYAGVGQSGTVWVRSFKPYLYADALTLSSSAGGTINLTIDFPTSMGGMDYTMLASATGAGPSWFYGIQVPLTKDSLFNLMENGNPPSVIQGAYGTLDVDGDSLANIVNLPGGLSKHIGSTLYCSVVAHPPATAPVASSAVVSVLIEP